MTVNRDWQDDDGDVVAGASYDDGDNNDGRVDTDDCCGANGGDGMSKTDCGDYTSDDVFHSKCEDAADSGDE